MIEASSSNHYQLQNDEIDLKESKRAKMTKTFGLDFLTNLLENKPYDFLTYLLENKPYTCSKVMSCPKAFYWKEAINSEIESIMNSYT